AALCPDRVRSGAGDRQGTWHAEALHICGQTGHDRSLSACHALSTSAHLQPTKMLAEGFFPTAFERRYSPILGLDRTRGVFCGPKPSSRGHRKGGAVMTYEPPKMEEVGSVRELTLALSGKGSADQILWIKFGDKPGGGGGIS